MRKAEHLQVLIQSDFFLFFNPVKTLLISEDFGCWILSNVWGFGTWEEMEAWYLTTGQKGVTRSIWEFKIVRKIRVGGTGTGSYYTEAWYCPPFFRLWMFVPKTLQKTREQYSIEAHWENGEGEPPDRKLEQTSTDRKCTGPESAMIFIFSWSCFLIWCLTLVALELLLFVLF